GAELPRGPVAIRGVAWSGAAAIARVEVWIDRVWRDARLIGEPKRGSWQGWELMARFDACGVASLRVRATDRAGQTQPDHAPWNRLGYGNNSIHEVTFQVVWWGVRWPVARRPDGADDALLRSEPGRSARGDGHAIPGSAFRPSLPGAALLGRVLVQGRTNVVSGLPSRGANAGAKVGPGLQLDKANSDGGLTFRIASLCRFASLRSREK